MKHMILTTVVLGGCLALVASACNSGRQHSDTAMNSTVSPPHTPATSTGAYANEFYSFRYSAPFRIDSERVVTEHRFNALGTDDFGLTQVILRSDDGMSLITIRSIPYQRDVTRNDTFAHARSELSASLKPGDTLETISVDGQQALEAFLPAYDNGETFRSGTHQVVLPTNAITLTLTVNWYDSANNVRTSQDQQAFQLILNSFKVFDQ